VLKLILQQQENHANCHHIFGQIPDLSLNVNCRVKGRYTRGNDEDGGPRQETSNRNKGASARAAISEPEMQATDKIDGEENTIQREITAIPGPMLHEQ
jgi:hypothetical protein